MEAGSALIYLHMISYDNAGFLIRIQTSKFINLRNLFSVMDYSSEKSTTSWYAYMKLEEFLLRTETTIGFKLNTY